MSRLIFILILGDALLAIAAHYCGFWVWDSSFALLDQYPAAGLINALFFACTLLLTSSVSELYGKGHYILGKGALARVIASLGLATIIFAIIYSLAPQIMVGKGAVATSLVIFGLLQFFWHGYYPFLLRFPGTSRNLLILGSGPLAEKIANSLSSKGHNYRLVGFVRPHGEPSTVDESHILGDIDELVPLALEHDIHKIVIALTEQRGVLPIGDLLKCRFNGIDVDDSMSFYEEMTGKVLVKSVNPGWFIYSAGFDIDLFALYTKRFCDIVFSLLGITLSWPLMLLVAAAIKLDSPGPIFFRQVRVGKNEETFELYKFRTMREDAEKETGAVWALKNDSRVTRIGQFLRKTRLDEMPQFFNVLRGEMAFVGPRPERPEFVLELYQLLPYYTKRHAMKPGVTGWAQVKYPYGASVEDALEKLNFDLYYIKNYSIFLDILILIETVQVVLFGKGGR
ncbi:MAG: glycosyl transferase, partial [Desulfuromonas sp.]